jgi:hypothetical protein
VTPSHKTIVSGVKTANRHTTGHQMTDVGDLLWLNLDNVKGQNLSAKDRPLFEGQASVNELPLLAVASARIGLSDSCYTNLLGGDIYGAVSGKPLWSGFKNSL